MTVRVPTFPTVVVPPPAPVPDVHVLPVTGPRGPAGLSLEHRQDTPAALWSIPATGFTRRPAVALYVGDELVDADVTATPDLVVITFPAPVAGAAVLT